jgi:hypothetical protein
VITRAPRQQRHRGLDIQPLDPIAAGRDDDEIAGHSAVSDLDSDEAWRCLAQAPHRLGR